MKLKIAKMALATAAIAMTSFSAKATTIDFGTSWPAGFTAPGAAPYNVAPLNRLLKNANEKHGPEAEIATFINAATGGSTSFVAADIHKTNMAPGDELGGSDGYFTVPSGWEYLFIQYGGPNGDAMVLDLDGNDAKVPFDSASIYGTGDKYAVSHYAVAGVVSEQPIPPTSVPTPDGGATAALLGIGLIGVGVARKFSSK
jgi:hypothetical protein